MKTALLSFLLCTAVIAYGEDKTEDKVLILHKGDPFPPPNVIYSYDSEETKIDFDRRREELRKADVKSREAKLEATKCSDGG